jgi:CO/xanthine dehydrogenase Mo-binding subunit
VRVLQIEGAFMQGVGHVLTEEVLEDAASGATLSSSTWSYKPPGIAELPRVSRQGGTT